jgi:hypothetical protein
MALARSWAVSWPKKPISSGAELSKNEANDESLNADSLQVVIDWEFTVRDWKRQLCPPD